MISKRVTTNSKQENSPIFLQEFRACPPFNTKREISPELAGLIWPRFFFFFFITRYLRARGRIHNEFSLPSILSLSLFFLETSSIHPQTKRRNFHIYQRHRCEWQHGWWFIVYSGKGTKNDSNDERKIQTKFCPRNISLENDPKLLSDPKMTRLALEKSSAGTGKGGVRTFSESVDSWQRSSTFWLGAKS